MRIYSVTLFDLYFFWSFIYFLWSVRTNFRICRVPVNFLIQSVRFWNICDEMILQYTSEARIWILAILFITLIIRVASIEEWFHIALLLSLLRKVFLGWVWTSTVTATWLRKLLSLVISYWIINIEMINLYVIYR